MQKYILIFGLLFIVSFISAQVNSDVQKARLCNEYYNNGEFQKAAECYKDLHEKDKVQDYYYQRLLACLLELQQYDDADKMIRKAIKAAPDKVERYVNLGSNLEKQKKNTEAKEQYDKALKLLPASQVQISNLANSFINIKKFDYALQSYEKGEKLLKEKSLFAYEMAGVYREKADAAKMTECYLNALEYMPNRLTNIQAYLQRHLPEMTGSYDELKKQL